MAPKDRYSPAAFIYYTLSSLGVMQWLLCLCVSARVGVCVSFWMCVCYMLLYSLKTWSGLLLLFLLIRTSACERRDGEKGERGGWEGIEKGEQKWRKTLIDKRRDRWGGGEEEQGHGKRG